MSKLAIGFFGKADEGIGNVDIIESDCSKGKLIAMKNIMSKCTSDYVWFVNQDDTIRLPSDIDSIFADDIMSVKFFGHDQNKVYMGNEVELEFNEADSYKLKNPLSSKIIKSSVVRKCLEEINNFDASNIDEFFSVFLLKNAKSLRSAKEFVIYENSKGTVYDKTGVSLNAYKGFVSGIVELCVNLNSKFDNKELSSIGMNDYYNELINQNINMIAYSCKEKYNSLSLFAEQKVDDIALLISVQNQIPDFSLKQSFMKTLIEIMNNKSLGFMSESVKVFD